MAVAIKVFNGSASGSSLVYTVPVGRCAKIIVGYLEFTSATVNGTFSIGGYTISGGSSGSITAVPVTTYGNEITYLAPGATVSVAPHAPSVQIIIYQFVAIEELQS